MFKSVLIVAAKSFSGDLTRFVSIVGGSQIVWSGDGDALRGPLVPIKHIFKNIIKIFRNA